MIIIMIIMIITIIILYCFNYYYYLHYLILNLPANHFTLKSQMQISNLLNLTPQNT